MSQSVVAVGNFDGVHRGHQRVLAEALGDGSLPLVVVTFWPHPISVLRPDKAPLLLCDLTSRIELLKQAGASEVRVVRFSPQVAAMTPEQFIDTYLVPLEPVRVVVGENFRFGRGASGDVASLAKLGAERGFEVRPLPLEAVGDQVTCSSLIRQALAEGRVDEAADHLGRPFRYRGLVVVGDQRGRELGFPTANVGVEPGMAVPVDGVYAGWLTDEEGTRLPAAISVGPNPTFDGVDTRVESYVLDRDDLQLYGQEVSVDFVQRLRGQVRFDGVDDLIAQMEDDVDHTKQILGVP